MRIPGVQSQHQRGRSAYCWLPAGSEPRLAGSWYGMAHLWDLVGMGSRRLNSSDAVPLNPHRLVLKHPAAVHPDGLVVFVVEPAVGGRCDLVERQADGVAVVHAVTRLCWAHGSSSTGIPQVSHTQPPGAGRGVKRSWVMRLSTSCCGSGGFVCAACGSSLPTPRRVVDR